MSIYEKEFSSFPAKNITRHNFKNIDDSTASLIEQIKLLRLQGLHEQAADIIKENKEILERCNIDSVVFRTWEEEIFIKKNQVNEQLSPQNKAFPRIS